MRAVVFSKLPRDVQVRMFVKLGKPVKGKVSYLADRYDSLESAYVFETYEDCTGRLHWIDITNYSEDGGTDD